MFIHEGHKLFIVHTVAPAQHTGSTQCKVMPDFPSSKDGLKTDKGGCLILYSIDPESGCLDTTVSTTHGVSNQCSVWTLVI